MDPKTVGIVHEHDVLRRGLAGWLEEDQLLALAFAVATGPPQADVDAAVVSSRALSANSLHCPLVLVDEETSCSSGARSPRVHATLSLRLITPDSLLAAVRAAAVGLRTEPLQETRSSGRLDDRRLRVLQLLATGHTTRTISEKLAYSERTIKGIISELEHELHAKSRAQAVAEAIWQGLI
jgi:DNA-binding NarL/FixJ family response regulator